MAATEPKARDLMAPDTEPTDDELALVMQEAGAVAREKSGQAAAFVRDELAKAVAAVLVRAGAR